jgi:hypothetical protein
MVNRKLGNKWLIETREIENASALKWRKTLRQGEALSFEDEVRASPERVE